MRKETYHGHRMAKPAGIAGLAVAAAAGCWIVLRRWRPFAVAVEGDSMRPALEPGDLLVAVRSQKIEQGMLAVFLDPRRPGFELVKRVAAVPGERAGGRMLGPGEYWILGDRPEASTDSRTFGPAHASAITGVVVARYWPPGRAGLIRH
jgi:nickel-type superoxide dismutase maturation protease